MNMTATQKNRTARLAALVFVVVSVPTALWGLSYVPSKVLVSQDPAATAGNILANELIFRTSILSDLISAVSAAVMALLFYRLFREVNKHIARLMIIPVVAQLAIVFILELLRITALMILKGNLFAETDAVQRQEFSYFLLRMFSYGMIGSEIFWGLFFLLLGILVSRSDYAPRIVGILLVIGGVSKIGDTCTFLLLQRGDYSALRPFIKVSFTGAVLSIVWFLIRGAGQKEGGSLKDAYRLDQ